MEPARGRDSTKLEYVLTPSGVVARMNPEDVFGTTEVLEGNVWVSAKNKTLSFLGEIMDGRMLSEAEIAALPALPSTPPPRADTLT